MICAVHSDFGLCVGVYLRYPCVCVKEKLCDSAALKKKKIRQ